MKNSALFLEELKATAKNQENQNALNKLNNTEFQKSFNEVMGVLDELGLHLNNSFAIPNQQKEIYCKISSALIRNFFTVYYVNIQTGLYVGYSSNDAYNTLKIETKGNDFFEDVTKNIPNVIYEDDQEKLKSIFNKDYLFEKTNDGNVFRTDYRLLLDGTPTHVSLTAIRLTDEDVIIGVSNNEDTVKREIKYQNTIKKNLTYTNISLALCRDYFTAYYVDMTTNEYEQYQIDSKNQKIVKIDSGKDFFEDSIINAKKYIFKEDLDKFLYTINKENVVKELLTRSSINISYRQLINGVTKYVSLNIIDLANDTNHIVFAVRDVNDQKRKEKEYTQKIEKERLYARTDGLTGIYNRNYFLEVQDDINHKIKNGTIKEFSTVMCDINDLKTINDTYGHDVGDKFIIDAKNILNEVFKDSLIFRVGGDEFIVFLSGNEYKNRELLMEKINTININHKKEKKVILACGYSDFDSSTDTDLNSVLKRADKLMYENKKVLKML